jgi:transposase
MGKYVGLDVSLKETSVCILRDDGSVVFEGKGATDPAVLARLLRKRAPDLIRVGLEIGPTSAWLTHALAAEGLPVVCLDARHAQAVLSVRPNKSDPGDARGLAEMVRAGWFGAVQVKSMTAHERKALLIARHQLIGMLVQMDNQVRGILKTFRLVIGACSRGQIGQRARELAKGRPEVDALVSAMVVVRDSLVQQIPRRPRSRSPANSPSSSSASGRTAQNSSGRRRPRCPDRPSTTNSAQAEPLSLAGRRVG